MYLKILTILIWKHFFQKLFIELRETYLGVSRIKMFTEIIRLLFSVQNVTRVFNRGRIIRLNMPLPAAIARIPVMLCASDMTCEKSVGCHYYCACMTERWEIANRDAVESLWKENERNSTQRHSDKITAWMSGNSGRRNTTI